MRGGVGWSGGKETDEDDGGKVVGGRRVKSVAVHFHFTAYPLARSPSHAADKESGGEIL